MFDEIFNKWVEDPSSLTSEERKIFFDGIKAFGSGKVPKGSSYKNYDEFARVLNDGTAEAARTPSGAQSIKDMVRENNTDRFTKRNKPFFDSLLAGNDLITSISQIKNSNRAMQNLQIPTAPNPNVLDPALNNAIAQAQQGSLEAMRALEPAKQEIANQRMLDMQTAKSVSGGNSGTFGALATSASLRGARAGAQLPQMADSIRMRQQQRADSLIGVRQGALQNEFQNRMGVFNQNLGQYNQNINAAGALGVTGRINLRNTIGQFPNAISGVVGGLMPTNNPFDTGGTPQADPSYSDGYSGYNSSIQKSTTDRLARMYAMNQQAQNQQAQSMHAMNQQAQSIQTRLRRGYNNNFLLNPYNTNTTLKY